MRDVSRLDAGDHFFAAHSAFCECVAYLLRGAVRAVELRRDFQVWRGKPDPLGADVMHVGEDSGDVADVAGRPSSPNGGG